jgi:ankyrin repeat protein
MSQQSLLHAVSSGNIRDTQTLIDARADIEAIDRGKSRPLHRAAVYGCAATCELLIERGADYNAHAYCFGDTALGVANRQETAQAIRAAITQREAPWTICRHHTRPNPVKQSVVTLMLLRLIDSTGLHVLPRELMYELFRWL